MALLGSAVNLDERVVKGPPIVMLHHPLSGGAAKAGASLGIGEVRGGMVVCDRHLWAFRLDDGVCPDAPRLRAETFEIRVQGEQIQVLLP